jgi:hypothetical protein
LRCLVRTAGSQRRQDNDFALGVAIKDPPRSPARFPNDPE